MNPDRKQPVPGKKEALIDRAADWFVRRDRGLERGEEIEFEKAIQSDPALAKELEKFEQTRNLARNLPLDLAREMLAETETLKIWNRPWLAAAALFAILLGGIGLLWWGPWTTSDSDLSYKETLQASTYSTTRVFPDGSLVRLNAGSEAKVYYARDVRQVHLLAGEAHFTVQKDSSRPFIVQVNQIQIQALGTVFNVKRSQVVDVIVTEGTIKIVEAKEWQAAISKIPDSVSDTPFRLVSQGQRAEVVLPSDSDSIDVAVFLADEKEVEEELQWRRSLLTIEGENLVEIAANFERKTGYRLVIADPSLGELQIGGRFPSDDVSGFLRILRDGYGISFEELEDGAFSLGRRNR